MSLYGGFLNGVNALLFGSFLGITAGQVVAAPGRSPCCRSWPLAVIARPLLFASVDPDVAAARGVPVRWLSVVFLVLLGVAAAEVSQITGTLLVFALLVVPAATAQALTAAAGARASALAVGIGLGGRPGSALFVAYYSPYPIGFFVTSRRLRRLPAAARLASARLRAAAAPGDARDRPRWRPVPGSATCWRTRSCGTRSWPAYRDRGG